MISKGRLFPETPITGRIDLDEIVTDGFEALLDDESDDIKILVRP
jgi:(R,R)-butanediol dehydrogenase/meso-butanediol dehydrogenase/diacetyl reductase